MPDLNTTQRFLIENTDIRGEMVTLTSSYLETIANHNYPEAVSELLGQFLAAAVLLGSTLKFDGRLVLQARGDGQLSLLMSEYTSAGQIRGIARFQEPPDGREFSELIGRGTLVITVDSKRGKPYQGIVALETDSLSDCLQDYFRQSEQLGTWIMLASNASSVSAIMLQQLPAQLQKDAEIRAEQWQNAVQLAQTLREDELLNLDNQTILHRLYHEHELRLLDPREVRYQCSCNRERTARALLAIGRNEVESIVAEQGGVAINCEFCGTEYNFGPGEVDLLFTKEGSLH
jgi:molecular chaperone Hsp33